MFGRFISSRSTVRQGSAWPRFHLWLGLTSLTRCRSFRFEFRYKRCNPGPRGRSRALFRIHIRRAPDRPGARLVDFAQVVDQFRPSGADPGRRRAVQVGNGLLREPNRPTLDSRGVDLVGRVLGSEHRGVVRDRSVEVVGAYEQGRRVMCPVAPRRPRRRPSARPGPYSSRRRSSRVAIASAPTTQTRHQASQSGLGADPENGLNL